MLQMEEHITQTKAGVESPAHEVISVEVTTEAQVTGCCQEANTVTGVEKICALSIARENLQQFEKKQHSSEV